MTSFDIIPNRRKEINLNKWSGVPKDILPMWIADMDFPAAPPILDALHRQVDHGVLGYENPAPSLFEAIATRMDKLYHWRVDPEWIVNTPGVNSGYLVAANVLCDSKRGFMTITPVYNEFLETKAKAGVPQLEIEAEVKVSGNRIRHELDFDALTKAAKRSKMFLLCSPHNPLGKIYSRAELKQMVEICLANDLVIVSDEIHSELLLGGKTFTPTATLSREIADRTITLIAASKTFNVPGLHCAFAIIPNSTLREQYKQMVYKMGMEVANPGMVAARVAFSGTCDSWLKDLRRYLTGNRDFIVEHVSKHMPEIRMTMPDATYLMWFDCSQLGLKESPYDFFLKNAKLMLSNGARFGKGGKGYVRMNFGTSRKLVAEGLERMRKAIGKI